MRQQEKRKEKVDGRRVELVRWVGWESERKLVPGKLGKQDVEFYAEANV